ncbi:MAG: DUF4160 domain-containing protein [Bacteroidia bacterium]|nr:DUF4160 domain-containing protein [Bacteroidia bacterium]
MIDYFEGIKIYIYLKDHNPPHFHAIYAEHSAEITIKTLEVIAGSLPVKQLNKVREWAKDKQEILLNEFIRLQK